MAREDGPGTEEPLCSGMSVPAQGQKAVSDGQCHTEQSSDASVQGGDSQPVGASGCLAMQELAS